MGKKSGDAKGAAKATAASNEKIAAGANYAERGNSSTPWGSTSYSPREVVDPATGESYTTWDQTQAFSSPVQSIYDNEVATMSDRSNASRGMMQSALDAYSTPADFDQFGDVVGFDPTAQVQSAEDAFYAKQTNRLDPQFAKQRQALETKLANQGLTKGDRAYDAAIESFGTGRNDAYEQARLGSVEGGMAMYGQQMEGNKYANALRQQQIDEYVAKRNFGLNEAQAVQGGGIQQIMQGS